LTVVLSLVLLPCIKGSIVGLQWANEMHGFGSYPDPDDGGPGSAESSASRPHATSPDDLMTSSSTPTPGSSAAKILRPRDASTLVIVDQVMGVPRVLMGRRHLDQVFMPGKYVFPGGRVDAEDRTVESADALEPIEAAKLLLDMKGNPSQARRSEEHT